MMSGQRVCLPVHVVIKICLMYAQRQDAGMLTLSHQSGRDFMQPAIHMIAGCIKSLPDWWLSVNIPASCLCAYIRHILITTCTGRQTRWPDIIVLAFVQHVFICNSWTLHKSPSIALLRAKMVHEHL